MQRITITLDDELMEELDRVIAAKGYQNRSEAIRDLARRLTNTFHDHHSLAVSSMHVHLDHDNCLEIGVLKGPPDQVQHFAEHVISERAVRYGHLHVVPAG